jgi:hypothetical protein
MFYCHLVYFMVSWYISPRLGMLHQEKSGNPDFDENRPLLTLTLYDLELQSPAAGVVGARYVTKLGPIR